MSVNNRKRKRNRLGKCDMCRSSDARYTCPRCETVTCSLDCVKRHKKELDCDGIRVRTKYVPIEAMNEHNLLSDYRLLEDVKRCIDDAEWQRESLETPLEAVCDTTFMEQPVKASVHKPSNTSGESKEGTLTNSHNDSVTGKRVKKGRKSKSKKTYADPIPKSDLLIAKAERIRQEVLRRQELALQNSNGDSSASGKVTNAVGDAFKDDTSFSSSSSEGSSSMTDASFEDDIDESEDIVVPLSPSTKTESTPVHLKSAVESKTSSENRDLARKEQIKIRKAQLLEAVTLGGQRKNATMEALSRAALTRGIYLCSLPEKFEKHWENTSFHLPNNDCIYWHIKVCFINANLYSLTLKECAETMTLEKLLKGCFRQSEEYWKKQLSEDPLLTYRTVDLAKITVLMSADKVPNNKKKFYVLDLSKSLKENFVGKCIVEFPQLCIAIEDCHVVSKIQENPVSNFFGELEFSSDEEEMLDNQFKKDGKSSKRKKIRDKTKDQVQDDSDKESGELTDSSNSEDSNSDTDTDESSDEEIFDESEFRSIYKDLLNSFENDLSQLRN